MTIDLHLIGAGEFRSFREDIQSTAYFLRFLRTDGAVFDLPATEEQLGAVLDFAAAGTAPPAPPTPPTPPLRVAPSRAQDEEIPPPPLQLRRSSVEAPVLFQIDDDDSL